MNLDRQIRNELRGDYDEEEGEAVQNQQQILIQQIQKEVKLAETQFISQQLDQSKKQEVESKQSQQQQQELQQYQQEQYQQYKQQQYQQQPQQQYLQQNQQQQQERQQKQWEKQQSKPQQSQGDVMEENLSGKVGKKYAYSIKQVESKMRSQQEVKRIERAEAEKGEVQIWNGASQKREEVQNPFQGEQDNTSVEQDYICNYEELRKKYLAEFISGSVGFLLYIFCLFNWAASGEVGLLAFLYIFCVVYIVVESFWVAKLPKDLAKDRQLDYKTFQTYVKLLMGSKPVIEQTVSQVADADEESQEMHFCCKAEQGARNSTRFNFPYRSHEDQTNFSSLEGILRSNQVYLVRLKLNWACKDLHTQIDWDDFQLKNKNLVKANFPNSDIESTDTSNLEDQKDNLGLVLPCYTLAYSMTLYSILVFFGLSIFYRYFLYRSIKILQVNIYKVISIKLD